MLNYRKKPVVIEAIQFNGYNSTEIEAWMIGLGAREFFSVKDGGKAVLIHTLEGIMEGSPGDYIIRGVAGEFYPCKPDIFDKTYDPLITLRLNTEIEKRFTYHAPKPGQPEKYVLLRDKGKELAYLIQDNCPDSRERSLALTKLEEAIMWANAAIARNG